MPDAPPPAAPVRLIDNWRTVLKKARSVRVAYAGIVFWGVVTGLWAIWPAFVEKLPFWFYAIGGVLMSILIVYGRVTKQPELSE
jgi:hypothetical protein